MHTVSPLPWLRLTRIFAITIVIVGSITLVHSVWAVGIAPAVLTEHVRPGAVVERTITVVNTDDHERSFAFDVENFTPSDTPGVPLFDGGAHDDLPLWVHLEPAAFSLEPGGVQEVRLRLSPPQTASPGDYFGAVSVKTSRGVSIDVRAVSLVFLTVEGDATYGVEVVLVEGRPLLSSSLRQRIDVRVQNSGEILFTPEGVIVLDPLIGRKRILSFNPDGMVLLAGQSRTWSRTIGEDAVGFLGHVRDELRGFALGPVSVWVEVQAIEGVSDARATTIWVVPWRLGAVLALACTLFGLFVRRRQHSS